MKLFVWPAKSTDSYLNTNAVLSAAVLTEAEAIHPGLDFGENSKFMTTCEEVGVKCQVMQDDHGYDGRELMLVLR